MFRKTLLRKKTQENVREINLNCSVRRRSGTLTTGETEEIHRFKMNNKDLMDSVIEEVLRTRYPSQSIGRTRDMLLDTIGTKIITYERIDRESGVNL